MTQLTEAQTEIVLQALSEGIAAAIDREFRAPDRAEQDAHAAVLSRYMAARAAILRQIGAAELHDVDYPPGKVRPWPAAPSKEVA